MKTGWSGKVLLLLLWLSGLPATQAAESAVVLQGISQPGGLQVTMECQLVPLRINQMHSWVIRVTDADGAPVEITQLRVSGGMPLHDHGLPTQPGVTASLGEGRHLLEGVRFHMPGTWEFRLDILLPQGTESVTLPLEL